MQMASIWLNLGIWSSDCPTYSQFHSKNAFFRFFPWNWAYVGQSDDHIGWATFASIYPTNPRTNLWNFSRKIFENWRFWKTQFFWVGHFEFYFSKKKNFFASSQWKLIHIYRIARIFWNFDDYSSFQPQTTPA